MARRKEDELLWVGFVVVTEEEREWARQQFGQVYADKMVAACKKAKSELAQRAACLALLVEFSKKEDPRLHTSGSSESTRTVI